MHSQSSEIILRDMLQDVPLPTNPDKVKNSKEEYLDESVRAANRLNKVLKIVSALVHEDVTKLHQGIMLGMMVRITKLYESYIILICSNQNEASMLIARAIVETSINLNYIIKNISNELCIKFIKSSLSYDKKLYEYVKSKIGNSTPKDFEKRLLKSIEDNFKNENIKIEEVTFKEDNKWAGDLFTMATKVNSINIYEAMYRYLSRVEHGSWHHLKTQCLIEEDNFYLPELNLVQPEPQVIFSCSFLCAEAALNYITYYKVTNNGLIGALQDLSKWFQQVEKNYIEYKDNIYKNNDD